MELAVGDGASGRKSILHRTVPLIFDGFDIDLPATHRDGGATAEVSATTLTTMLGFNVEL